MKRWLGKRRPTTVGDSPDIRAPTPVDAARSRIAAADDIDDVIAALKDTARAVVGSDGITIVRREGDEVVYVTEDAISPLWSGQRFPIQVCVSGMAIQARATIAIADIISDSRVPMNAYLATFVRSMAMVPIGCGDPMMAIGAYWQVAGPMPPAAIIALERLAATAAETIRRIEGPRAPARQAA